MPRDFKLDARFSLRFRNGVWVVFDHDNYRVDFGAGAFGCIADFERRFKVKVATS